MIIDSHCHAWRTWPYEPAVAQPEEHASLQRAWRELVSWGVSSALVVAARLTGNSDNNEWLTAQAPAFDGVFAIAADWDSRWLPTYHAPDADARLGAILREMRPRAVAHYLGDADDGWFGEPATDVALALLAEHATPLSLHAPPGWRDAVIGAARRHPGLPIVLHHLAFSGHDDVDDLRALAACDNVYVKASGAYYASAADSARTLAARTRAAVDLFGPLRVLWGSDHPVAQRRGFDPRVHLEAVAAVLDPAEQRAVLGDNARRLFFEEPE